MSRDEEKEEGKCEEWNVLSKTWWEMGGKLMKLIFVTIWLSSDWQQACSIKHFINNQMFSLELFTNVVQFGFQFREYSQVSSSYHILFSVE
jgi:hypothetical protein